jgi:hypothetical protein
VKIYIVSKMVDREDEQSSTTVSAHVDSFQAKTAAQVIDHQGIDGVYGIVEPVELDLTAIRQATIDELRDVVG